MVGDKSSVVNDVRLVNAGARAVAPAASNSFHDKSSDVNDARLVNAGARSVKPSSPKLLRDK